MRAVVSSTTSRHTEEEESPAGQQPPVPGPPPAAPPASAQRELPDGSDETLRQPGFPLFALVLPSAYVLGALHSKELPLLPPTTYCKTLMTRNSVATTELIFTGQHLFTLSLSLSLSLSI